MLGLLTDASGEPLSVQVYEGNTSDPTTVADQIEKLAARFKAKDVVMVGDHGMIRGPGNALLAERGLHYITSLMDPEIRALLAKGTLQPDLFDTQVTEVESEGVCYILRRNAAMTARTRYWRYAWCGPWSAGWRPSTSPCKTPSTGSRRFAWSPPLTRPWDSGDSPPRKGARKPRGTPA